MTELIAAALEAPADQCTVQAVGMVFDVRPNPDAGLAADFIGWPVKIEAEAEEPDPVLVETVSSILTAAWNRSFDAVAACDRKDELPELGGFPRYR